MYKTILFIIALIAAFIAYDKVNQKPTPTIIQVSQEDQGAFFYQPQTTDKQKTTENQTAKKQNINKTENKVEIVAKAKIDTNNKIVKVSEKTGSEKTGSVPVVNVEKSKPRPEVDAVTHENKEIKKVAVSEKPEKLANNNNKIIEKIKPAINTLVESVSKKELAKVDSEKTGSEKTGSVPAEKMGSVPAEIEKKDGEAETTSILASKKNLNNDGDSSSEIKTAERVETDLKKIELVKVDSTSEKTGTDPLEKLGTDLKKKGTALAENVQKKDKSAIAPIATNKTSPKKEEVDSTTGKTDDKTGTDPIKTPIKDPVVAKTKETLVENSNPKNIAEIEKDPIIISENKSTLNTDPRSPVKISSQQVEPQQNTDQIKKTQATQILPNPKDQPKTNTTPTKTDITKPNHTFKKRLPKKLNLKTVKAEDLEYTPMSFNIIASYEMPHYALKKDLENIPDYVKALSGKTIAITGFMIPIKIKKRKVLKFMLVRGLDSCCFGAQIKINEAIYVEMPEGKHSKFYRNLPIAVFGKFKVEPEVDEDVVINLYNLEGIEVISPIDNAKRYYEVMKKIPRFQYSTPAEPAPQSKPVDPTPQSKPIEPAPQSKPAESTPQSKAIEPNPQDKPTELDPQSKPLEKN